MRAVRTSVIRRATPPILLVVCLLASACGTPPTALAVALSPASPSAPAHIRVSGLSSDEVSALTTASLSEPAWQSLLSVRVAGGDAGFPAVAGRYEATGTTLVFTPRFPFDAGRAYTVTFDPTRMPRPRVASALTATVSLAAVVRTPEIDVERQERIGHAHAALVEQMHELHAAGA